MKSGLTPLFSDADIDRWFDKFQERAEEGFLNYFLLLEKNL